MEIRKITEADSSDLLELLLRLDNETKFMMIEPGEREISPENMKHLLSDSVVPTSVFLGAFSEDELVGYVNACRGNFKRIEHTAYIVIGILSSSTGQGIGTLLLKKVEEWARKYGITRLELTVMTHNKNAIKLYEKMGFEREGIKKNSMFVDGNYVDEFYMSRILDE